MVDGAKSVMGGRWVRERGPLVGVEGLGTGGSVPFLVVGVIWG